MSELFAYFRFGEKLNESAPSTSVAGCTFLLVGVLVLSLSTAVARAGGPASTPCQRSGTTEALESTARDSYVASLKTVTNDLEEQLENLDRERFKKSLEKVREMIDFTVVEDSIERINVETEGTKRVRCRAKLGISVMDSSVEFPVKYTVRDGTVNLLENPFDYSSENLPENVNFGMSSTRDHPRKQTDEPDVEFNNFRIVSRSPHELRAKVDYRFETPEEFQGHAYLNALVLSDGKRLTDGFESEGDLLRSASGTATITIKYRTLNPQWDGESPPETTSTDKLQLRLYPDEGNRVTKTYSINKNWTLARPHRPSDTIPDDPSVNSITVKSVDRVDSTSFRVNYDYAYRSDHGPAVHLGAHALAEDGMYSSCCTFIEEINRGEHSGSVKFSRRLSSIRERPVTDQLQLSFRIGISGETFFTKTIDHRINWRNGSERGDTIPATATLDTGLENLLMRIRSRDRLEDVPSNSLQQYLKRAAETDGTDAYERLLDVYLLEHRDRVAASRPLFNEALRILTHARESLPTGNHSAWFRSTFRRFFVKNQPLQPLYRGPFDDQTFRRVHDLTQLPSVNVEPEELDVSNIVTYHPDHPTLQVPDRPVGNQASAIHAFVRVPTSHYLETIRVNRLIPGTVADTRYNELFREQFGAFNQSGYRTYTASGRRSSKRSMNFFGTEDFWVPVQDENLEWIALTVPRLGLANASYRFEFTSFDVPDNPKTLSDTGAIERTFDHYSRPLKNWAETVEKAYSMDSYASFSPPDSPSDTPSVEYRVLTGAFYLHTENYEQARQWLSAIPDLEGPYTRKWAQMYGLLPLADLTVSEFLEYRRSTLAEQINYLEGTDRSLLGDYSLARNYWKSGRYKEAQRLFSVVLEELPAGDVLWEESTFYTISSLYRQGKRQQAINRLQSYLYRTHPLRSGGHKPFFFEVEGTFTNGLPMRNYLVHWLKAMENGRRSWWYERIGEASEPIRYYRYFATTFEGEPIGRLVTDSFLDTTQTQRAYMNHKGIRAGIPEGPITRNELFMVLPWNNRLHSFLLEPPDRLSRPSIRSALESVPTPPNPVQGRGPGSNYYSGRFDVEKYVGSVLEQGDPPGGIPVVTMPEFLTRMIDRLGDAYLWQWTFRVEPHTGREKLASYLRSESPVQSPIETENETPSSGERENTKSTEDGRSTSSTGLRNLFSW